MYCLIYSSNNLIRLVLLEPLLYRWIYRENEYTERLIICLKSHIWQVKRTDSDLGSMILGPVILCLLKTFLGIVQTRY